MLTATERSENFRLARATMTNGDAACNFCGHIWAPINDREACLCPNCRRVPTKDYLNAPLGDVPFARVRAEKARLEAKARGEKVALPPQKNFRSARKSPQR